MEAFAVLTGIRLLAPLLILKYPLVGILLASLIDIYDWVFFPFGYTFNHDFYQTWDKGMDAYYQLLIMTVVMRIGDLKLKWVAIFFFLYRITGIILAYIFATRQFLFFFPNFFENLVIMYLSFALFSKRTVLFSRKINIVIVLTAVIVPKVIHEYFQHFLLQQPWEIFNIGCFLTTNELAKEYANYIIWGSLFYIIPLVGALFILLKINKPSHTALTDRPIR